MIGQRERINIHDIIIREPVTGIDLNIDREKLLELWRANFKKDLYREMSWNPLEKQDFPDAICLQVLTDATSEELGFDEDIWIYELKRFEKLKKEMGGDLKLYSLVASMAILFPEKSKSLKYKHNIQFWRQRDFRREASIEDIFNVCVSVPELLQSEDVRYFAEAVMANIRRLRKDGQWSDYEAVASRAKFLYPQSFETPTFNKKEISEINKRLNNNDFGKRILSAASWHVILAESAQITDKGLVITPRTANLEQEVTNLPEMRKF